MTRRSLPPTTTGATHPADRAEPVADLDPGQVLHLLLGHRRVADGEDARAAACRSGRTAGRPAAGCWAAGSAGRASGPASCVIVRAAFGSMSSRK